MAQFGVDVFIDSESDGPAWASRVFDVESEAMGYAAHVVREGLAELATVSERAHRSDVWGAPYFEFTPEVVRAFDATAWGE